MVNNKNKLGRAYQNKNESLYGDVNSVICFLLSLCFIWIIFHYLKNVLSSKPNQISSLSSMTKPRSQVEMNSFNHSEGNLTSEVPRERKEEIQNKEITEQENPNRGHKDEEEDWHLVEKI